MPFPPTPQDSSPGLFAQVMELIERQKQNLRQYLDILRHQNAAIEKSDDEKLERYQEHETACRDNIVSTTAALRGLEGRLTPGSSEIARIREERQSLESLRREALAANTLTQERLRVKMQAVASELTALQERLRALGGGKSPDHDDPTYIDVYS
jgi:chromosome segregation ATPase